MAGEYIQADTIKQYWKELKAFYQASSPSFKEINKKTYDSFHRSEREDSDNHLNFDRLGDDTKVVDVAFYKYLPDSKTAYKVHIVDVNGKREDHYFIVENFS